MNCVAAGGEHTWGEWKAVGNSGKWVQRTCSTCNATDEKPA